MQDHFLLKSAILVVAFFISTITYSQITIECLIDEPVTQATGCYDCTTASDTSLFTGFRITDAGVDTTMIESPWRLKVDPGSSDVLFFDYRNHLGPHPAGIKFFNISQATQFPDVDSLINWVQECHPGLGDVDTYIDDMVYINDTLTIRRWDGTAFIDSMSVHIPPSSYVHPKYTPYRVMYTMNDSLPAVEGPWNELRLYRSNEWYMSMNHTYKNIAFGEFAGAASATGFGNVSIGSFAGNNLGDAHYNTLIGYTAGSVVSTGGNNMLLGRSAGSQITTGSQNTYIGNWTGFNATGTSGSNIFIGYQAGYLNRLSNQVIIGDATGLDTEIFYGNQATDSIILRSTLTIRDIPDFDSDSVLVQGSGNEVSKWAISDLSFTQDYDSMGLVVTDDHIVFGRGDRAPDFATDFVYTATGLGIGTSTPATKFHLDGTARFEDYPNTVDSGTPTHFWGPVDASGTMGVFPVTDIGGGGGTGDSDWYNYGTATAGNNTDTITHADMVKIDGQLFVGPLDTFPVTSTHAISVRKFGNAQLWFESLDAGAAQIQIRTDHATNRRISASDLDGTGKAQIQFTDGLIEFWGLTAANKAAAIDVVNNRLGVGTVAPSTTLDVFAGSNIPIIELDKTSTGNDDYVDIFGTSNVDGLRIYPGGSYAATTSALQFWDESSSFPGIFMDVGTAGKFYIRHAGGTQTDMEVLSTGQMKWNQYTGTNFNSTEQYLLAVDGATGLIYKMDTTGLGGTGGNQTIDSLFWLNDSDTLMGSLSFWDGQAIGIDPDRVWQDTLSGWLTSNSVTATRTGKATIGSPLSSVGFEVRDDATWGTVASDRTMQWHSGFITYTDVLGVVQARGLTNYYDDNAAGFFGTGRTGTGGDSIVMIHNSWSNPGDEHTANSQWIMHPDGQQEWNQYVSTNFDNNSPAYVVTLDANGFVTKTHPDTLATAHPDGYLWGGGLNDVKIFTHPDDYYASDTTARGINISGTDLLVKADQFVDASGILQITIGSNDIRLWDYDINKGGLVINKTTDGVTDTYEFLNESSWMLAVDGVDIDTIWANHKDYDTDTATYTQETPFGVDLFAGTGIILADSGVVNDRQRIAIHNDAAATDDADIWEVGGVIPPDTITDNGWTKGRLAIGADTISNFTTLYINQDDAFMTYGVLVEDDVQPGIALRQTGGNTWDMHTSLGNLLIQQNGQDIPFYIQAGYNDGSGAAADTFALSILNTGEIRAGKYGRGNFTGSAAYNLQIDATGRLIETSTAGGGGADSDWYIKGTSTAGGQNDTLYHEAEVWINDELIVSGTVTDGPSIITDTRSWYTSKTSGGSVIRMLGIDSINNVTMGAVTNAGGRVELYEDGAVQAIWQDAARFDLSNDNYLSYGVGANADIIMGWDRTAAGNTWIDLHADTDNVFDARLIRWQGVDGQYWMQQQGNGQLILAHGNNADIQILHDTIYFPQYATGHTGKLLRLLGIDSVGGEVINVDPLDLTNWNYETTADADFGVVKVNHNIVFNGSNGIQVHSHEVNELLDTIHFSLPTPLASNTYLFYNGSSYSWAVAGADGLGIVAPAYDVLYGVGSVIPGHEAAFQYVPSENRLYVNALEITNTNGVVHRTPGQSGAWRFYQSGDHFFVRVVDDEAGNPAENGVYYWRNEENSTVAYLDLRDPGEGISFSRFWATNIHVGNGGRILLNNSTGSNGQVITSNGTTASWADPPSGGGSLWTDGGSFTYNLASHDAVIHSASQHSAADELEVWADGAASFADLRIIGTHSSTSIATATLWFDNTNASGNLGYMRGIRQSVNGGKIEIANYSTAGAAIPQIILQPTTLGEPLGSDLNSVAIGANAANRLIVYSNTLSAFIGEEGAMASGGTFLTGDNDSYMAFDADGDIHINAELANGDVFMDVDGFIYLDPGDNVVINNTLHLGAGYINRIANSQLTFQSDGDIELTGTNADDNFLMTFPNGGVRTPTGTQMYVGAASGDASGAIFEVSGSAYKSDGSTLWTNTSDRRIKRDIVTIEGALSKILNLNPVEFYYKDGRSDKLQRGFIAQEYMTVFPEDVNLHNGLYEMAPNAVMPYIVKSIQEMHSRENELEARVDYLEKRILALEEKQ